MLCRTYTVTPRAKKPRAKAGKKRGKKASDESDEDEVTSDFEEISQDAAAFDAGEAVFPWDDMPKAEEAA